MDSQTIIKTLNSPKPPMFNVAETLDQNNSTFKDVSSSPCLKPKNPTPNSQENENGIGFTTDDTEISIFDAQKYFSESNDIKGDKQSSHDLLSVPRLSSVSSIDGHGRIFPTRPFRATPAASSANPPGVSLKNSRPDHRNKRLSAAKKWFFGRKCCCNDEKSVEVSSDLGHRAAVVLINSAKKICNITTKNSYTRRDRKHKETISGSLSKNKCSMTDKIVEIHHMAPSPWSTVDFSSIDAPRQQRVSAPGIRPFIDGAVGFTFPILNPSSDHKPVFKTIMAKSNVNPLEDSLLEGFRPIHELPSVSSPSSVDNIINARGALDPGSPIPSDDDVGSDASSDLFEIESFSIQTTPNQMCRKMDSVDEDPTCNALANGINNGGRSLNEPPTPSIAASENSYEVSTEWSGATVEGYDRESVANLSVSASQVGDVTTLRPRLEEAGGGDGKKKGNIGLMVMSCRQEKAVGVGPQPVKCAAEGPPMYPLHMGGKPRRANTPPPGSCHSARLSLAFAA